MASRIATRAFTTTARRFQQQAQQSEHVLKAESKRNPELMVRQNPPHPNPVQRQWRGLRKHARWRLTRSTRADPRYGHGCCSGRCWFLLRYVVMNKTSHLREDPRQSSYAERRYAGRTPTSSTSEQKVPHAGMPWETGSGEGKYSYYPGGDRSAEPKEAPSAINVVVVPDVNLPKVGPRFPPMEKRARVAQHGIHL